MTEMSDEYWVSVPPSHEDEGRRSFEDGVRFAAAMIAQRIRAELVCCTDQEIAAQSLQLVTGEKAPHFHDICYWGEMSARLAEDPHSLLVSPYNCPGDHPGPCWSTQRCKKLEHAICQRCFDCTVEGCGDVFCAQDGSCTPIGKESWQ